MKQIKNKERVIGLLFLLNVFLSIASSNSCMFKYVPDADIDDPVEFPWDGKTTLERKNPPKNCECGIVTTTSENSTTEKPWVALIRIRWPDGAEDYHKDTYCSGSLINSKFILTAYSCFVQEKVNAFDTWGYQNDMQVKPEDVTIWIDVKSEEFNPSSDEGLNVTDIIFDKNYVVSYIMTGMISNNVALLKLKDEIDLEEQDSLVPVCLKMNGLNSTIKIKSGTMGQLYGWYPGHRRSKSLLHDGIQLRDTKECRVESEAKIADGNICSPELVEGKQFDGFGSPLGIGSKMKQILLQVGILSWNDMATQKKSGKGSHQLVYTTTKSVLPFINHFSEEHDASWCKEPESTEFLPDKETKRSKSLEESLAAPWVWNDFTSDNRTETTNCTCGMHNGAEGRIVGGVEAKPHEFKWQVLLKVHVFIDEYKKKKHTSVCGGSLINDRMILLAAHCIVQIPLLMNDNEDESPIVTPNNIEVHAYVHQRTDDKDAIRLKVKRVMTHPGYISAQIDKPPFFDWDVALLELEEPVKFDQEKIFPICLPKSGDNLETVGKIALVTGWGLTNSTSLNSVASTLQKIDVPIQKLDYCRTIALETITENFICAGTLNRNKDAAQGDSGGPLSIIGSKTPNQFFQVGIVSWGEDVEGSDDKTAALYSDVQTALSYIDYYSNEVGALWCAS